MNITFRKPELKRDTDFLYTVYSEAEETREFSRDITFSTREEFSDVLQSRLKFSYYEFFIIEADGTPVGLVYGHDYAKRDLTVRFSLYICPAYRRVGIGAVAAYRYVKYLFDTLPVRKVYVTVFGCNKESLANNLQAGFTEEAVLREYVFVGGEFVDLHYLSVTRAEFAELCKRDVVRSLL